MGRVDRFDIFQTRLDPTVGSEQQKTRPCVIVSPNEFNHYTNTVIIVPLSTKQKPYPFRVPFMFDGIPNDVLCEQIRTVDKRRFSKKIGQLEADIAQKVSDVLTEMFHI